MIDIETLGTRSNSIVLSIGAVNFDITGENPVDISGPNTFHRYITPRSCKRAGLVHDQSTIDWWSKQSAEARNKVMTHSKNGDELAQVLDDFSIWLNQSNMKYTKVWGNGPSFDITILENAYRACNLPIPWLYHAPTCVRTIAFLAAEHRGAYKIDRHTPTLAHDALADAVAQCKDVQNYYRILCV